MAGTPDHECWPVACWSESTPGQNVPTDSQVPENYVMLWHGGNNAILMLCFLVFRAIFGAQMQSGG